MGFRQQQAHHHQVHHGKTGGSPGGKDAVHLTEHTAEPRPQGKAQPEGDTNQSEGFGSVLRRGDIGQNGCGRGGGSAADAIDDPSCEQQGQGDAGCGSTGPDLLPGHGEGGGEQAHADHGAADTDADHRFAAETITEGTDQWCHSELGEGVGPRQQTDGAAAAAEVRQQKGQQR